MTDTNNYKYDDVTALLEHHNLPTEWSFWYDYIQPNSHMHLINMTKREALNWLNMRGGTDAMENYLFATHHDIISFLQNDLSIAPDGIKKNDLATRTLEHLLNKALSCENFVWKKDTADND